MSLPVGTEDFAHTGSRPHSKALQADVSLGGPGPIYMPPSASRRYAGFL